ncbi:MULTISPECIES: WYL domain-containing protein [Brevibacillus]|uniref:WYL domain-containing protein n=1 Tax=Brevibacillus invocatus TaxID=173959 RepID=A0A3M8CFK9_9BACL|nr:MULTISPECIES: WYL domain-containing protein [Brevibacillus]MDH4616335.1 WYL domain-containing protein [Brevibacillus sp. AY1]RNB74534.1 WYL domain-containing protein [Brevibacillus invocatus]
MVKELHRAMAQNQHIQIIYLGSQGQTTMRTLRPLEIVDGRLKAYCLTRKAPRVFVIDRILAVEPVVIRHAM